MMNDENDIILIFETLEPAYLELMAANSGYLNDPEDETDLSEQVLSDY